MTRKLEERTNTTERKYVDCTERTRSIGGLQQREASVMGCAHMTTRTLQFKSASMKRKGNYPRDDKRKRPKKQVLVWKQTYLCLHEEGEIGLWCTLWFPMIRVPPQPRTGRKKPAPCRKKGNSIRSKKCTPFKENDITSKKMCSSLPICKTKQ